MELYRSEGWGLVKFAAVVAGKTYVGLGETAEEAAENFLKNFYFGRAFFFPKLRELGVNISEESR